MSSLQVGDEGSEVRVLQEQLRELGFLGAPADGHFESTTRDAVRAFQAAHGLAADGIVGPRTQARVGEEINTALRHAKRERDSALLDLEGPGHSPLPEPGQPDSSSGSDFVRQDRVQQILATAVEEWRHPVHEPPGEGWERIDTYIRGSEGLGWSSEDRYVRNRQFAWCGAFASLCLGSAGLNKDLRKRVMPSTYRLYTWAKDNERMRTLSEVASGDIVVVGPSGGKRWGAHITICDHVDAAGGFIHTIEGNASGQGPANDRYEGVVRQSRPMPSHDLPPSRYRVLYVIRPLAEDYD
jgi:Putative peptidoglycan binding domain